LEILAGRRRGGILESFGKGAPADVCRKCSAYQPDTIFALSFFSDVHPGRALPPDFFRNIMT